MPTSYLRYNKGHVAAQACNVDSSSRLQYPSARGATGAKAPKGRYHSPRTRQQSLQTVTETVTIMLRLRQCSMAESQYDPLRRACQCFNSTSGTPIRVPWRRFSFLKRAYGYLQRSNGHRLVAGRVLFAQIPSCTLCYLSQPAEQKSCSFGGCSQRVVPNEAQHLQHGCHLRTGPLEGKITYVKTAAWGVAWRHFNLISHLIEHIGLSLSRHLISQILSRLLCGNWSTILGNLLDLRLVTAGFTAWKKDILGSECLVWHLHRAVKVLVRSRLRNPRTLDRLRPTRRIRAIKHQDGELPDRIAHHMQNACPKPSEPFSSLASRLGAPISATVSTMQLMFSGEEDGSTLFLPRIQWQADSPWKRRP